MEIYTTNYLNDLLFPMLTLPLIFLVINFLYLFPGRFLTSKRQAQLFPLGTRAYAHNGYYLRIFLAIFITSLLTLIVISLVTLPEFNLVNFAKRASISSLNSFSFERQFTIANNNYQAVLLASVFLLISANLMSALHFYFILKIRAKNITEEFLRKWNSEKAIVSQREILLLKKPSSWAFMEIAYARFLNLINNFQKQKSLRKQYYALGFLLQGIYFLTFFSRKEVRKNVMEYYYSKAIKELNKNELLKLSI